MVSLEERLAFAGPGGDTSVDDLVMLVDLYLQADSYVPALETIDRLLSRPEARTLPAGRRAVLEIKAIACRLAQGNCQAALAHCREVLGLESEIESERTRSRLHLLASEALMRLVRLEESARSARRGLALAESAGDLSLIGEALKALGRVAYREGDQEAARRHYDQALVFFERVGDELNAATIRSNLGLIHKNRCEWDAAIAHFTAALETRRHAGRFADTGVPLLHLGIVHQKRGDWRLARECYEQAQQVFVQIGDQLRIQQVDIGLGNVARLERRFVDAETSLLQALERARVQATRREEALALEFLGELDADRGRPEAALARYDQGLALAERMAAHGDLVVEIERRRAELLAELGRVDEAESACTRARDLAGRVEDRLEGALTYRAWSAIAAARGRRDEAIEHARRAVALVGECRERYELARSLVALGRLTAGGDESRRCFSRALGLFGELESAHGVSLCEDELRRSFIAAADPAPARPGSLLGRRHRAPGLVACSPGMRRVEALAQRAAGTELSVLITGETGTGKELVARTIHALSPRAAKPFMAVNCGALRADLALSQLFGHRKGAFTGAYSDGVGLVEAAHGGTLFLDEVGELPHDVQVTLLRFLETGEYLRLGETQLRRADVRVIAATNRELRGTEGERLFRRDLLFRFNEIEILVPALRDRGEDTVSLARHFLAFYGGIDGPRLAPDAEAVLLSYPWPGNVRELENVMKRVAALNTGEETIDGAALLPFLSRGPGAAGPGVRAHADEERRIILEALSEARGNKSRVAEILGVSRKTLYARLKRLQIEPA